ncbi:hypothetical protein MATL_G00232550 [Megalops atlanticus]|uniref:Ig-like domain-containing protein n=1 Tax=Megalops atlanticus TaxID=7932 RepID=A0A9D3PHK5_MEGAT|nr:hypothetical protein MATL_G00232550 [Megalops atlanticus]
MIVQTKHPKGMASVRFRDTLGTRARLLLLCCIYPLKAQHTTPVPQFPEFAKVQVGDTISLQCDLKGLTTYCYTIAWMKIHPRTRKMEVCKNSYTDSKPGTEAGSQICHFSLQNAKVEDSGTYYCSAVHGQIIYTGNGSTVIVTDLFHAISVISSGQLSQRIIRYHFFHLLLQKKEPNPRQSKSSGRRTTHSSPQSLSCA